MPGGLPEHIKALKAAVDKQRAEVPALVMKQTSAHLEALQSFDGALEEIENMKRDTENLLKSHGGKGGAAVDVQRDLLEKCEQLPELQRRLPGGGQAGNHLVADGCERRRRRGVGDPTRADSRRWWS